MSALSLREKLGKQMKMHVANSAWGDNLPVAMPAARSLRASCCTEAVLPFPSKTVRSAQSLRGPLCQGRGRGSCRRAGEHRSPPQVLTAAAICLRSVLWATLLLPGKSHKQNKIPRPAPTPSASCRLPPPSRPSTANKPLASTSTALATPHKHSTAFFIQNQCCIYLH